MIKYLFFAISLPFVLSCHQKGKPEAVRHDLNQPDSVHFSLARQGGPNLRTVNLLYLDEKNENIYFQLDPNEVGTDSFHVASSTPIFLLDWTENQNYFIVYPNEDFVIYPSENGEAIRLVSQNKQRNDELNFFELLTNMELDSLQHRVHQSRKAPILTKADLIMSNLKDRREKDFVKAEKTARERLDRRMSFIKNYNNTHTMSARSYGLMESYFKYYYFTDVFASLNRSKSRTDIQTVKKYLNFTDDDFNCDTCLFIPSYQSAVDELTTLLFSKNGLTTLKEQFSFVDSSFKGKTKEFLLFRLLKNQFVKEWKIDSALYNIFAAGNRNPVYQEYLETNIGFLKNITGPRGAGETGVIDNFNKKDLLKTILSGHKDHLILLDFWASWCKPCIAEIPLSLNLHHKYKNKNVMFVYLSLDKDAYNWQQAAKHLSLAENSYLVLNNFDSEIATRFKIKSIPRYVLLGKNGSVIHADAPRPLNSDLEKLIDQHLSD